MMPNVEFYEDFARCYRGFDPPHNIPYSDMRLTWIRVGRYERGACLLGDSRDPKLDPYRVNDMKMKHLDRKLFDWLATKVPYSA